jgi:3-methyl-2-oxobutanoate hydroxymethyltransferase
MALSLTKLQQLKTAKEPIVALTAYDASFARVCDEEGVEVLLVGDSLGMVVQGHATTLPVRIEEMIYHTQCVTRGAKNAWVIADLPFGADLTTQELTHNAVRLMKEGGAHMVKMEGGVELVEAIGILAKKGVPVCAHVGLRPQSVHKLGGYKVQGVSEEAANQMIDEAKALQAAGADMLVVECVPAELGERLATSLSIPVIGIGAGVACDGQVLVVYDILGLSGLSPKFSHNFLEGVDSIAAAIADYVSQVKAREFPTDLHGF